MVKLYFFNAKRKTTKHYDYFSFFNYVIKKLSIRTIQLDQQNKCFTIKKIISIGCPVKSLNQVFKIIL